MSPITGKLRLAFSAIRDILRNNKSGYSAVWSSAFDWGSKGREFKSLYPDHFFDSPPTGLLVGFFVLGVNLSSTPHFPDSGESPLFSYEGVVQTLSR